ncbi:MAG TPA: hypothetical protein VFW93_13825 [Aquabacterium sp.]|uniref:hypothetical protein n=1 Tax=Aquabacterium sp. TaxID=1872578 RepID=UPI002E32621C|nr:hypothetical protein [Aquabacterium sp.]HEX5357293.1 hypothetical protein [Aquabacterium sp.]
MAVADDVQDDESTGWGGKLALLGGGLALAGGIYWAVTSFHAESGGPKRQTVKIAVLPDTPPPLPPPVVEKKPEPEIKEQKPQPQQEEQKPLDKAPEPEPIKMDGEAGNGPSAFSAGQVNKEYQKGEIGTGQGGAGDRLQEALFGRRLQKHIQQALARDKSIKLGDYRVKVSVWLDERGVIQRVQLDEPTGDDKIDRALRESFARLPTVSDMPAGIRQPVRLAISNRMTG